MHLMAAEPRPPTGNDPWGRFSLDPRMPAHAGLRAADVDRDVIHQVLAEAYSEGRLDRGEFDERTEAVTHAKLLGELPHFVADLLPTLAPPVGVARIDLRTRAEESFRRARREAIFGFLTASIVCWGIWWVLMGPRGFPWPIFVMLGTGINALRITTSRSDYVASEVRRLEKKEQKEQRAVRRLPPGGPW